MSVQTCYYYDADRNRCKCYIHENLDELLKENARLEARIEELENRIKEMSDDDELES